jgi:5'-nucleotidase
VVPGSVWLNGKPVVPEGTYRVVANSFLAAGGDGFTVLAEGTNRQDSGVVDLDAMVSYLRTREQQKIAVGAGQSAGRIQRTD